MPYERVLTENPHVQSRAALMLLKKDLLRHVAYHGYQGWLRFRWETLNKILLDDGVLKCHYCNKQPLLIDADNKHPMVATLDHVIPRSKGGAEFDLNNLVVACHYCNQKKKDHILSKDLPKDFIFKDYPSQVGVSYQDDDEQEMGAICPVRVGAIEFQDLEIGDIFTCLPGLGSQVFVKTARAEATLRGDFNPQPWGLLSKCYYIGHK